MRCTQPNFTKGGGGGGGAPPRCPIPFLLCIISSRKGTRFGTHAIDKCYPFHIPSLELCIPLHWWIQGRGPGGPGPPLFFDQNGVHNQILLREAGGVVGAPPRCPIPFLLCIISGIKGTRFGTRAIDKWYPFHIPRLELCIPLQWRIQGRGPGGPGPPLFFDQNEARRTEKNFFGDRAPLISGCG